MISFHRQSIDDEFSEDDEDSINKQYKESMHSISTVCSCYSFRLYKPMVNNKLTFELELVTHPSPEGGSVTLSLWPSRSNSLRLYWDSSRRKESRLQHSTLKSLKESRWNIEGFKKENKEQATLTQLYIAKKMLVYHV